MEWQALVFFISFASLGLSVFVIFSRVTEKTLSVREHAEFKQMLDRDQGEWRVQFHREIDIMRDELRLIQSRVPTTGELDKVIEAVEARLSRMEDDLRNPHHHTGKTQ